MASAASQLPSDMSSAFRGAKLFSPLSCCDSDHGGAAREFSSTAEEIRAARSSAGLFDRSHRGLLRVGGPDRKTWLHNLVTNAVKPLTAGQGVYAFVCDVRGRAQFDLNILDVGEELWLDVHVARAAALLAFLSRYLIMEKAAISDASADFARLGVCGPHAAGVAEFLGVASLADMPALAQVVLDDGRTRLLRHDFALAPGFEMLVPRAAAAAWWDRVASDERVTACGFAAEDFLRIEAGIPWFPRDIDEKVIPPETGQAARGIHYSKGCYLGQEVIERMRSHGSMARRLVRLELDDGAGLELPSPLHREAAEVGRITSLVQRPDAAGWLGLGYLRTSVADASGLSVGTPARAVRLRG
jgi:folate-binding protein YgfZ